MKVHHACSVRTAVPLLGPDRPMHFEALHWPSSEAGECDLVTFEGDLSGLAVHAVGPPLLTWIDASTAPCIHLGLSGIARVDEPGLELLVEVCRRGNERGRVLQLHRPSPCVTALLEAHRLGDLVDYDPGSETDTEGTAEIGARDCW